MMTLLTFIIKKRLTLVPAYHPPCNHKSWPFGIEVTRMSFREADTFISNVSFSTLQARGHETSQ